jgi:Mlc titration factor MtfA (ptsG expression regulator)
MFAWLRRRVKAREIPEALWQSTLADYPFLREYDGTRLRQLTGEFLGQKEFHGAQGLQVTDAMAIAVAVQAVLPVLHLGLGWYDDFVGIVLQPDEVVARRTAVDETGVVHDWEEVLAGEAMEHGPVMLSWHDVALAGTAEHAGYNVVIHEFVHKIDMRDGAPDGCPPLPSKQARAAWLAVMQPAYERFREAVVKAERFGGAPTWLDPYGAESIDEFFAVASEAYFTERARFGQEFAPLLALFDGFFGPQRG